MSGQSSGLDARPKVPILKVIYMLLTIVHKNKKNNIVNNNTLTYSNFL